MIITFISFQNFYSFKNKTEINFLVNENAPQTNHFGLCNEGSRFAKISFVFGANASGKTNLILAFEFLKSFISDSFSYSSEGFKCFYPFETMKKKSSSFKVEFYIKKVFYRLSLEIDSTRVLSEILEGRKNKRLVILYSRQYDKLKDSYTFEGKNIELENSFIEKVRPNSSVISTANQYNHPELTKIRKHWRFISGNCFTSSSYNAASKFYHKNEEYFQQTKKLLKNADLGLSDIQIEPKKTVDHEGNKKTIFRPYGEHKSKGKIFQLPFTMESSGTQQLYNILRLVFRTLAKGSVCLIDAIEDSLHPNILPNIVNLFTSENPKNAQLICTTHMPTLMGDLSKSQIFLVEKDLECESEAYRLDEVEGVRNDDNFFKKYLAGAYGGVPDIDM